MNNATTTPTGWTVNTYPSRKREHRTVVIAFRGEGRSRQVINVELIPEAVKMFDPDTFWALRGPIKR